MEPDERRERMRALRERVCDRDVQEWVASFLSALKETEPVHLAMPNALSNWNQLSAELEGRRPVLFLDYDGTLTPIVSRPEDARLSPDMKATLQRLAEVMPVVLISGRARTDLQKRAGLQGVVLAGSHGFDIAGPNVAAMEVGAAHKDILREAAQELHKLAMHVPGVAVEDKTLSVAVHYRRVDKSDVQRVLSAVDEVLGRLPALERHYGKKVIELRPAVDWDKGRAVSWLLNHLDLDGTEPVPIFLGDDRTDEDAFTAVAENGIGILIASEPRPTNARYSLRNVQEVKAFLDRIADRFVTARRGA
jgi:trehalose-phosphatase